MAMNMMDMIMQAAGGNTAQQAGSQFGLSPEMSQKAIGALLPAISSAMKQNTASPQGLAGLLGALQNGGHEQYLDNPQALSQNAQTEGNAILGHLFGTKEVSRAVAGRASEQTGIDTGILKQMLPMVAMMAMGGMSKQTNSNQGLQGMLAQAAMKQLMGGGNSAPKGGLGGMLGGLLGGGGRQVKQQQKAHQQGLGMLGKMLDADGDGNTMDDILGMVMNRR
ncbi:hypothetical protein GCM10009069_19180 [Algimonas arctica]|uniref:DUF937 domain-containing protein n=1 Tax=Algimonas arctica TaxID=1479486 RepID=A0A8J3G2S6_9PROT|nr:DUF937 domain-containing protein [Algimonas arctica]GHA96324.1 hypothetical protein GCM10009069_19180 [Algimonas arctica]